MSEERRKRKQERDGSADPPTQSRKRVLWGVVAVLFVAAFAAGRYYNNHHYDAFAKCLATKQAKMYGLYWCPHCLDQKAMFGKSFQYVPYAECAIKGSQGMAAELTVA